MILLFSDQFALTAQLFLAVVGTLVAKLDVGIALVGSEIDHLMTVAQFVELYCIVAGVEA